MGAVLAASAPRPPLSAKLAGVRWTRTEALDRFERATEVPLLLLALAMIPLLVVPLLVRLPGGVESSLATADWFIWAAFAIEYVVRLSLTDRRWRFVRREWPDLLIILLPFLRPLRIARSAPALRLLHLARVVAVLGEAGQELRRLFVRHQLHYAVVVGGLGVVGCAAAVLAFEEDRGGPIDSFGDALWWAITTVTTVGYGDTFPVTPAGRGVAALLMVAGIALFSVLTANLAAFMLERGTADEPEPTAGGDHDGPLAEILQRLDRIEALLAAKSSGR